MMASTVVDICGRQRCRKSVMGKLVLPHLEIVPLSKATFAQNTVSCTQNILNYHSNVKYLRKFSFETQFGG
jgi:hypothetical protein